MRHIGIKMGRRGTKGVCLAVLIPHRDCRRLLYLRSAELFAGGLWGAWSFPQAAPLALLSAPLGAEELAELARNLRRRSLEHGRRGMIVAGPERVLLLETPKGFPPLRIYGPALELRVEPEDFGPAAEKTRTLPPLLGCALLGDSEGPPEDRGPEKQGPEAGGTEGPELKFRAAAVANMLYRPLPAGAPGYSFSWKIGKLHWLPPCRGSFRPPEEG
jgi:hypothetical protein